MQSRWNTYVAASREKLEGSPHPRTQRGTRRTRSHPSRSPSPSSPSTRASRTRRSSARQLGLHTGFAPKLVDCRLLSPCPLGVLGSSAFPQKGEEVTFDYNYERVFGAATKKCISGSPECRGYIGGDPLNTDVIVQGNSDEEYREPVMVPEADERDLHMDMTVSDTIDANVLKLEQTSLPLEDQSGESPLTIPVSEGCLQSEDTFCRHVSDSNPLGIPLQKLDLTQIEDTIDETLADAQVSKSSSHSLNSIQIEDTMYNIKTKGITHGPVSDAQSSEVSLGTSTTMMKGPLSDSVPNNKFILNTVGDVQNLSKPYRLAKSISSSGAIKKAKPTDKTLVSNKGKKI